MHMIINALYEEGKGGGGVEGRKELENMKVIEWKERGRKAVLGP